MQLGAINTTPATIAIVVEDEEDDEDEEERGSNANDDDVEKGGRKSRSSYNKTPKKKVTARVMEAMEVESPDDASSKGSSTRKAKSASKGRPAKLPTDDIESG